MYSKDRKYIYYVDKFGEVIGYVDKLQPADADSTFLTIIAERKKDKQWSNMNRNVMTAVNLKKTKKNKFYEDYEEFCAEFLEAIL